MCSRLLTPFFINISLYFASNVFELTISSCHMSASVFGDRNSSPVNAIEHKHSQRRQRVNNMYCLLLSSSGPTVYLRACALSGSSTTCVSTYAHALCRAVQRRMSVLTRMRFVGQFNDMCQYHFISLPVYVFQVICESAKTGVSPTGK